MRKIIIEINNRAFIKLIRRGQYSIESYSKLLKKLGILFKEETDDIGWVYWDKDGKIDWNVTFQLIKRGKNI